MKIVRSFDDTYYPENSRILGNCFTAIDKEKSFHYEFIINKKEATIRADSLEYIEEAVEEFRKFYPYIFIFKTLDGSFYKSFDQIMTFKLPISILQVSQFFLNGNWLTNLREKLDVEEVYIPVGILHEEYVILGEHHRAYLAKEAGVKLISVYMIDIPNYIPDYVYVAKEQNLCHIDDMKILSNEQYEHITKQFEELFFNN